MTSSVNLLLEWVVGLLVVSVGISMWACSTAFGEVLSPRSYGERRKKPSPRMKKIAAGIFLGSLITSFMLLILFVIGLFTGFAISIHGHFV